MYCSCGQLPRILTATVWHLHGAACYGTQLRAKGRRSSTRISPTGNNLDSPEAVWLLMRKTGPIPRSPGNVNQRFWSSAACAASFFPLLRWPFFIGNIPRYLRNSGSLGLRFGTEGWIKGEQHPLPPLLKQIAAKKSQTTALRETQHVGSTFSSTRSYKQLGEPNSFPSTLLLTYVEYVKQGHQIYSQVIFHSGHMEQDESKFVGVYAWFGREKKWGRGCVWGRVSKIRARCSCTELWIYRKLRR